MSIKSKLLDKTGDLLGSDPRGSAAQAVVPAQPGATAAAAGAVGMEVPQADSLSTHAALPKFPGVVPGAGARTAPGQMVQFRGELLAKQQEVDNLRQELELHRGALPARLLDAKTIAESAWANRHEAAFRSAEFESLKRDIQASGGNVQPIRVRPVDRADGLSYEVVFGHRRLRACRALGLPVLAMIDPDVKDDATLFALMDRENRERADLSPYEQGMAYRRAIDAGLYPSQRRLAEALEVSHTWVAKALLVADLPQAIVECFASPLEIQHRHAKTIGEALARDGRAVLKRAEKLRQLPTRLSSGAVVASLINVEPKLPPSASQTIKAGAISLGKFTMKADGSVLLELTPVASEPERRSVVLEALAACLERAGTR